MKLLLFKSFCDQLLSPAEIYYCPHAILVVSFLLIPNITIIRWPRSPNCPYSTLPRTCLPNCSPIPVSALLWLPLKLRLSTLSPLLLHSLKLGDSVHYSGNLLSLSPAPPSVQQPPFSLQDLNILVHSPGGRPMDSQRSVVSSLHAPFSRGLHSGKSTMLHLLNFFDMLNFNTGCPLCDIILISPFKKRHSNSPALIWRHPLTLRSGVRPGLTLQSAPLTLLHWRLPTRFS